MEDFRWMEDNVISRYFVASVNQLSFERRANDLSNPWCYLQWYRCFSKFYYRNAFRIQVLNNFSIFMFFIWIDIFQIEIYVHIYLLWLSPAVDVDVNDCVSYSQIVVLRLMTVLFCCGIGDIEFVINRSSLILTETRFQ